MTATEPNKRTLAMYIDGNLHVYDDIKAGRAYGQLGYIVSYTGERAFHRSFVSQRNFWNDVDRLITEMDGNQGII